MQGVAIPHPSPSAVGASTSAAAAAGVGPNRPHLELEARGKKRGDGHNSRPQVVMGSLRGLVHLWRLPRQERQASL